MDQGKREHRQRLIARPSVGELRRILSQAEEDRGCSFQYVWKDPANNEDFLLKVESSDASNGKIDWHLFARTGSGVRALWSRSTTEAEQISEELTKSIQPFGKRERKKRDGFQTMKNMKISAPLSGSSAKANWEQDGGDASHRSPTFNQLPAQERASFSKPEVLTGDLSLVEASSLFQSISLGRMSGRLKIQRETAFAAIFFVDGAPKHAEGSRGVGEECFLQAVCWKDGEFEFEPKLKTDESTISRSLDQLLLEGALLLDCTQVLKEAGLSMQSILELGGPRVKESEVVSRVMECGSSDAKLEKMLYDTIDGHKTAQEVVEEHWLTRSKWVPAISNLFRSGLVSVSRRSREQRLLEIPPKELDAESITQIRNYLTNQRTGVLANSSLLYLLDHQLKYAPGVTISLILIGLYSAKQTSSASSRLTGDGVSLIVREIREIQDFNGIVGHYEDSIAVCLLDCIGSQASATAKNIQKALPASLLELAMTSADRTTLCIGCATYPEDSNDLPSLLAAAEYSLEKALDAGGGVMLARDLSREGR